MDWPLLPKNPLPSVNAAHNGKQAARFRNSSSIRPLDWTWLDFQSRISPYSKLKYMNKRIINSLNLPPSSPTTYKFLQRAFSSSPDGPSPSSSACNRRASAQPWDNPWAEIRDVLKLSATKEPGAAPSPNISNHAVSSGPSWNRYCPSGRHASFSSPSFLLLNHGDSPLPPFPESKARFSLGHTLSSTPSPKWWRERSPLLITNLIKTTFDIDVVLFWIWVEVRRVTETVLNTFVA
jgi:hypothetical protein